MSESFYAPADPGRRRVAFGLCGSFCALDKGVAAAEQLVRLGWEVLPVMTYNAASLDTRFGRAADWKLRLYQATGHEVIETLQGAEPLGPKGMADAMVIAPCTGATLARLDLGLSDTPVTLGAKSLLRGHRPVVIAVSTNDGLGASARHIAALLGRKDYFFVPFGQDDCLKKPMSLKADFSLLPETLEQAMRGRQFQPVLLS